MSWLLPCCRSAPPLAMGWRLGEVWLSGRGASCSPSLLLSSPLPEALPESEELLLPLLLICSITSTSARSSATNSSRIQTVCIPHQSLPPSFTLKHIIERILCFMLLTSLYVIELRLWGGIILRRRRGGLDPCAGLSRGPELRAGLAGPNRLLLDPGLNLTAALRPETHTHTQTELMYQLLVLLDPQQLFLIHLNPDCRMK